MYRERPISRPSGISLYLMVRLLGGDDYPLTLQHDTKQNPQAVTRPRSENSQGNSRHVQICRRSQKIEVQENERFFESGARTVDRLSFLPSVHSLFRYIGGIWHYRLTLLDYYLCNLHRISASNASRIHEREVRPSFFTLSCPYMEIHCVTQGWSSKLCQQCLKHMLQCILSLLFF